MRVSQIIRSENKMMEKLFLSVFAGGILFNASGAELPVVRGGEPSVTIVMPEKTEYDRYVAMEDEEAGKYLAGRFPKADAGQIAKLKIQYKKYREKEAKRVGDDEKLAAEEIQTYIEKISGAKLQIVNLKKDEKIPDAPAILLGSELAAKAGFGKEIHKLDKDGIFLKTSGNKLIISGKRARGTLYAAYDFLESLGCRWVMPGDFGELLPSTKNITTNIDKSENPSNSQRYWWCTSGAGKEYPRWTLRNKGNYVKALEDKTISQAHWLGGPLKWGATNTANAIKVKEKVRIPRKGTDGKPLLDADGKQVFEMVEKDVPALPDEYYALVDGKPSKSAPNMSNPKVWDIYADCYLDYFRNTSPFEDYVSISAEDGMVLDDHKESKKLDSNEYDKFSGAFSATDKLWFFHTRNIEKVIKEFPDRKFGVLVYANNMTPPRITTVHPNMALVFAPLGISPLFDVRNPKSKSNAAYREWFESWMTQAKAAGAETYYYDYEPIGFSWNQAMICPRWAIIGKNYPYFYAQGLTGHTTHGFDDWGSCAVDNWMMIRLYWNAKQDYREILKDYSQRRFAEAAPAMLEYFNILEQRMSEIPELCGNEIWGNHLVLTPEVRKKCRGAIDKAMDTVKDELAKKHVEIFADIQRSTDSFCDGIEHARETGNFAKAAKMLEPSFEIKDKLNKIYSHFMQPYNLDKKQTCQFRPGGWYSKYLEWDKKIKGSEVSMVLPRYWKVALDTDNVAAAKGLQKPEVSVAKLEDWDTTVVPDIKYQTQSEVAAFFYRIDVDVPSSFKDKKILLYFPSLISRTLQIWINGTPVEFDHGNYKDSILRGPPTFWYDYNHQQEFDVTPYIKPGQKNTIAFRVFKSFDHAGSYDRIFLLGNPSETKEPPSN